MACLALAAALLAVSSVIAQQKPKIPPAFAFELTGKSPGKVTFNHEKHNEHNPKCTDCHVKVFKLKRGTTPGPLSMARMEKGDLCGACHVAGKKSPKGEAIFTVKDEKACVRCHVKG